MNKDLLDTLPAPTSKPAALPKDSIPEILSLVDSSCNILSSITNIIESNNQKQIALTSMYLQSDIENKKIDVSFTAYIDKRSDNSQKFYAILNSSLPEEIKKELLLQLIEESKCIYYHL